jgi:hypothetical protein
MRHVGRMARGRLVCGGEGVEGDRSVERVERLINGKGRRELIMDQQIKRDRDIEANKKRTPR